MNELKSEIIINAGIRAAERNFTNAYVVKSGDRDAGAIFVKIDTLDGKAKLFARSILMILTMIKAKSASKICIPQKVCQSMRLILEFLKK